MSNHLLNNLIGVTKDNNNLNLNLFNALDQSSPDQSSDSSPPLQSLSPSLLLTKRSQSNSLAIKKLVNNNNQKSIPAFLTKLYTMVNDPLTNHLIKWNLPDGHSFFVVSPERFGKELLPKFFKHSNFGSFVRQLNMYGFHKVPHLNQGVLQAQLPETEMIEFINPNFQMNQPDLLYLIQRKKSCTDSVNLNQPESNDTAPVSSATAFNDCQVQTILSDIAAIKTHQAILSSDLKTLQNSTNHLWQEALTDRDRNKRCQDTINKILGFLAQVFGGKLSAVNNSARGNSKSSTDTNTDLDLHQTAYHNNNLHVLLPKEGTISDHDRLQSCPIDSRDLRHSKNNLNRSSPPHSALSVYPQSWPRRLMLEDAQRSTSQNNSNSSQLNQPQHLNNQTSLDSNQPSNHQSLNSFQSSPLSSQSALDLPSKDSNSRSLIPYKDSSKENRIDPNLESAFLETIKNDDKSSNPDQIQNEQSTSDSILPTLFSDLFSGSGLNWNDGALASINWNDLLNTNENDLLKENSSSQPTPTSPSPLRITNGKTAQSSNQLSPSPNSNDGISLELPHVPITDLRSQEVEIVKATNKAESLEAAIERLVSSLPQVVSGLPAEATIDQSNDNLQNQDPFVALNPTDPTQEGLVDQDNFDAEAFIRTLICPEDTITGGVGTKPIEQITELCTVHPDGLWSESLTTKEEHKTNENHNESNGKLDLDQILDEWAIDRPGRLTSNQMPLPTPETKDRLVIDLDDDQLRKIMRKRSNGSCQTDQQAEESVIEPNLARLQSNLFLNNPTINGTDDLFNRKTYQHPISNPKETHSTLNTPSSLELLRRNSLKKRLLDECNSPSLNFTTYFNHDEEALNGKRTKL
ncbi:hypothetical protein O181_034485 [Austropuccinia psidii MF-1]|uniref:HSF-type DNA-binding domain-containing protein n=1 Tax=Austropuccinia psidii MF-1 TaxID=1389203 RepID=A0A9Q3HA93_9BASI|nr:hypothetical protein [Austropuccinia psidii MF-1]